MKFSIEFDWKEVLALAAALLIGVGAGVAGSALMKQIPQEPVEIQVDGNFDGNLKDYIYDQMK